MSPKKTTKAAKVEEPEDERPTERATDELSVLRELADVALAVERGDQGADHQRLNELVTWWENTRPTPK